MRECGNLQRWISRARGEFDLVACKPRAQRRVDAQLQVALLLRSTITTGVPSKETSQTGGTTPESLVALPAAVPWREQKEPPEDFAPRNRKETKCDLIVAINVHRHAIAAPIGRTKLPIFRTHEEHMEPRVG